MPQRHYVNETLCLQSIILVLINVYLASEISIQLTEFIGIMLVPAAIDGSFLFGYAK